MNQFPEFHKNLIRISICERTNNGGRTEFLAPTQISISIDTYLTVAENLNCSSLTKSENENQ